MPITGQTLGVLLVGAAYGPGLGVVTVLLYLGYAVVGLPALAPNADGTHDAASRCLRLSFATGGYLWGFVVAAGLVGWLSRRGWDRTDPEFDRRDAAGFGRHLRRSASRG